MFNEGEVANLVPQLKENQIKPEHIFSKKEDVKTVYDIRNNILDNIKKNDPGFLAQFKQEMTSGNTDRIEKAYRQASGKVYAALLAINNITSRQGQISFARKLQTSAKEVAVMNDDGSLNKDETQTKLKSMILENGLKPIKKSQLSDDECITFIVAGVAVVVAVVVFVVVEAAAATDTYSYVTSSEASAFSGNVKNKKSLYLETLIGQIATGLQ
jgi:hypothetical protein